MNIRNTATLKRGFSMMELMISIAVIAILSITIGPRLLKLVSGSKVSAAKSALAGFKGAILDYYNDMGYHPKPAEGGLEALVKQPKSDKKNKWDGTYLDGRDEVPEDPWGNEYTYYAPPKVFTSKYSAYEIITWGESGEEGDVESALSIGE